MKTKAQKSINYSTAGAFVAAVPFIGWAVSPILILVSFILSMSSIATDEPGGARALVNSIVAIPSAIALAIFVLFVIGGAA